MRINETDQKLKNYPQIPSLFITLSNKMEEIAITDIPDIPDLFEKIPVVSPLVKRTEALEFTNPKIPGEIKVDIE